MLPDQHLGRNTAYRMGVPLDEMVVWDPDLPYGGVDARRAAPRAAHPLEGPLQRAHALHREADRAVPRKRIPAARSSSIPECTFDVVQAADDCGSTEYIIRTVKDSPEGSVWAVGTEIHLVNRLAREVAPARTVVTLDAIGLPLLDDVPHLAESSALGARRSRRRRGPQPHRRARADEDAGPKSRSIECSAMAVRNQIQESSPMSHQLPALPYDVAALEPHIDAQTMQIHHGKHHAAYVNNLNAALEKHPDLQGKSAEDLIKNLSAVPEEIRTAVRNNGGGHVNHTMFWQIMGPGKGGAPTGAIARRDQRHVRRLRRVQGTDEQGRRRPLRQRLGLARRRRRQARRSRARRTRTTR